MVTQAAGNADCSATAPPFINDCDYDAAGALLAHLLGPLAPPAQQPAGRLASFDQRAFGDQAISMDEEGYVYVPSTCERERCRVHVAFHGCRQGRAVVSERFAREAGYNRWADTQPHHRALSAGRAAAVRAVQPERLLGLVGLHRRALPHKGSRADPRGNGDARAPQRAAASTLACS